MSGHLTWRLVRADGRAPDVVAFEEAVVAFFIESGDILGVPKSVAAIYGICFASAAPLSFTDIAERLDISQGSISQGLRVLNEIGALKIVDGNSGPFAHAPSSLVPRPARAREYFAPNMELRKLATHFIENRLEKQLKSGRQRLKALKPAIPASDVAAADELNSRLKYLKSWQSKAAALIPLAKNLLKLT